MSEAQAPVEAVQAETAAPDVAEIEAPTQAQLERFRVKLPDGEKEVDRDELIRNYQLAQASYKKFEEASAKERAAQARDEKLRQDFIKTLIEDPNIGKAKFKEEVIKFLYDEFQEEDLSPEQLKAKKYDEIQRQKQEAEEAERRTQEEQAELAEIEQYKEQITAEYVKALDSVKLPKTTATVRAMAYLHQVADDAGIDLDHDTLATITRDALFEEQKALFTQAIPSGRILEVIGPEVLDAIRKADLAAIRAKRGSRSVSAADYARGEEEPSHQRVDPEEALRRFLESD